MRKELIFAVSMLAVAASCQRKEEVQVEPSEQKTVTGEIPVGFDIYTQRGVDTKAGVKGPTTSDALKSGDMAEQGFGVFAFYTDNNDYDPQSIPNFMYNEQVKYDAAKGGFWYEPVKYWPNEYGDRAESDDSDKISFFAYAPYVKVTPSTGKIPDSTEAQWGIAGMSRNSATGDPLVKYIASFDADKSVDLCWGVYDETAWPITQTGSDQDAFTNGKPWLNVQRPAAIDQKLKFTFKHALSQLYVDVDAFVDGTDNANALAENTKVWVRSITFSGMATRGALNLNNDQPDRALWLEYNGTNDLELGEEITVFDGRKDGKEGVAGAVASNEKLMGLNEQLIQDDATPAHSGVTNAPQHLFKSSDPVYVIPTGEDIKITIVYDIETEDDKLATYISDGKTPGTSVENRISKDIHFAGATSFENGKSYKIHLHLGMNSVKFDAEVVDWEDVEEIEREVDLPVNVPVFAAVASAAIQTNISTVMLPSDAGKYTFAISGLNGGEMINHEESTDPSIVAVDLLTLSSVSKNPANASGVAIQEVELPENMYPHVVSSHYQIWSGRASGQGVAIQFLQAAHKLGLSASELGVSGKKIKLAAEADIDWTNDIQPDPALDGSNLFVKKNGSTLNYYSATPTDGQFNWEGNSIVLPRVVVPGDIYAITVDLSEGDGPEPETVQVKIGGFLSDAGTINVPVTSNVTKTITLPVPEYKGNGTIVFETSEDADNITQNSLNPNTGEIRLFVMNATGEYNAKVKATFTPDAGTLAHAVEYTYTIHVTVE